MEERKKVSNPTGVFAGLLWIQSLGKQERIAVFPPVTDIFAGAHWRVQPREVQKETASWWTFYYLKNLVQLKKCHFTPSFNRLPNIGTFSAFMSQWKSRYDYSIRCYVSDSKVMRSCHDVSESTATTMPRGTRWPLRCIMRYLLVI